MSRQGPPPPDSGVVLLQVLLIVALASAAVMLMLNADEAAVDRSLRFREAAQATPIARGGEISAIVALRRDAVEAPESDDLSEPWNKIAETNRAIQGGTFSLAVRDAQARFNLNNLAFDPAGAGPVLRRLVQQAQAPAAQADLIIATLRRGPLPDAGALLSRGVDRDTVLEIAPSIVFLPTPTTVNVNTAGESVLAAVLDDPVLAALAITRRSRTQRLTPTDLNEIGVGAMRGLGFTSRYFLVETDVTIGQARQRLETLLARSVRNGAVEVAAIRRRSL